MQYDLHEGLNANELDVKDLKLGLERGHNLPVLLVHVDKERLKAVVDCLGEKAEVELEERVEEK